MLSLDHIVIAARSLKQGADYLHDILGVEVPAGGKHQNMATHNLVMQLGNDAYLEVIATDPEGEVPRHPRWFALDTEAMRSAVDTQPCLITWVVNCSDLQALASQADFDIGKPTELSRDALRWAFALPEDGRLLGAGMLPYCIQWHSSPHPSRSMADQGCLLQDLGIHHHRPRWLEDRLNSIEASHLVNIEARPDQQTPYLEATIETPRGLVKLR